MANIQKPLYTYLWAETGEKDQPDPSRVRDGWLAEIPPRQVENWVQNRQDVAITYLFQKGIAEWDSNTDYRANISFVQHGGVLYKCISNSTTQEPSPSASDWVEVVKIENSTESRRGIIQIATQGEVNQGINDSRAVTPKKLKQVTDTKSNVGHTHLWSDIINPPADYTPKPHTHPWSEITNKPFTQIEDLANDIIPAGVIWPYGGATAPNRFLLCDGSAVSRTTYARLYSVIGTRYGSGNGTTTFNVPNTQGVFLRGNDNGRGFDSGRVLGSYQDDAFKAHNHSGNTNSGGAHTHSGNTNSSGAHTHSGNTNSAGEHSHGNVVSPRSTYIDGDDRRFYSSPGNKDRTTTDGLHSHSFTTNSAGAHTHSFTTNSAGAHTHSFTTNNTGGSETRPKNLSVNFIIKT